MTTDRHKAVSTQTSVQVKTAKTNVELENENERQQGYSRGSEFSENQAGDEKDNDSENKATMTKFQQRISLNIAS